MYQIRSADLRLLRCDDLPRAVSPTVFQQLVNRDYLVCQSCHGRRYVRLLLVREHVADQFPGLIDYIVMCITYIFFYRACKAQGVDRKTLPYTGYLQPYCAWFALVWLVVLTGVYGYTSFLPFDVSNFFSNYTMQLFIPPLYIIWKLVKRTKVVKPHEADLIWEKPGIDAYESTFLDPPVGFWREIMQLVGLRRIRGGNDRRQPSISIPREDALVGKVK